MQSPSLLNSKTTFLAVKLSDGLHDLGFAHVALTSLQNETLRCFRISHSSTKGSSMSKSLTFDSLKSHCGVEAAEYGVSVDKNQGELSDSDEDDEVCPVDCVKEFKTDEEFLKILQKAKHTNSLVVVDFYRTSCGSCKYIEQGFAKLCRKSGDDDDSIIFLKHNVIDEYDEQSEVADRLRIKTVPLFHFYKNGVLLEAFPTRDKERILAAILKYTSSTASAV